MNSSEWHGSEADELRHRQAAGSAELPLVSVAMTAYNRASSIARAVESVLIQRTRFPVELVIGDDGSSDGTLDIAADYERRYPAVVRLVRRPKNVGIMRNYLETNNACRGRYIAWLDSDDVWTDPDKLQIQVELLESDPSVALVGHTVRWVTAAGEVERERFPTWPAGRYGIEDVLRSNFLGSPSVMFHNGLQRELPEWYLGIPPLTDWPLYLFATRHGSIVLLERNMADYTLSANSAMRGQGDLYWYTTDVRFYDAIEGELSGKMLRLALAEKSKRHESLAYFLRKQGRFVESRQEAFKSLRTGAPADRVGAKLKTVAASLLREAQWRLGGARIG